MRVRQKKCLAGIMFSLVLIAGCSFTGETFNTGGLNQIVVGRTTMEQAAEYLGAQPADVWRQGQTTLARWAYKGTLATDAVYFRQEAWLRFGPDGTFMRTENTINMPSGARPRTAEEADLEAAQAQAKLDAAQGKAAAVADSQGNDAQAVPYAEVGDPHAVASPGSAKEGIAGDGAQGVGGDESGRHGVNPLLPAGTQLVPGVTYPVNPQQ